MEDDKIVKGFDRGVDYSVMKKKLIEDVEIILGVLDTLQDTDKAYDYKKGNILRKYIYTLIAIIQLRNGSRISEAVNAFEQFVAKKADLESKVTVKIAKSKATKHKKDGEQIVTKTRYRKMGFPTNWVGKEIKEVSNIRHFLRDYEGNINKRVLDYLSRTYKCNTHSLRYAFINYMLYDQKKEMTVVAKFVGHTGVGQLVRYTQAKESDKLFDLDI